MNQEYKDGVLEKIRAIPSCDDLNEVLLELLATLREQVQSITDQLAKLQPYLELLELPTTPEEVIEWIKKLVDTVIKPLTLPTVGYQSQLVEYAKFTAEVVQEVGKKAQEFTNCEIG